MNTILIPFLCFLCVPAFSDDSSSVAQIPDSFYFRVNDPIAEPAFPGKSYGPALGYTLLTPGAGFFYTDHTVFGIAFLITDIFMLSSILFAEGPDTHLVLPVVGSLMLLERAVALPLTCFGVYVHNKNLKKKVALNTSN